MYSTSRFKFFKVLATLLLIIVIGTVGFMIIEEYSFIEALFMTVITLSTVGYGTGHNLSDGGMLFTVLIIPAGVGVMAYAATIFADEIIAGTMVSGYKKRSVEAKIKRLENHVIICGFGRNGRQAARKLKTYNQPFLVIDKVKNEDSHRELEDIIFIEGDATDDRVLQNAKIEKATAFITALPSDADNLFIVLTARQMNPNVKIISRASNRTSMRKLKIAGANNVIMPDKIGGDHMASLIVTPDLVEFLDKISVDSSTSINMKEVTVDDLPEEYLGKTIKELEMRSLTGCTIIGLKTITGEYRISPEYNTVLTAGMHFIILGKPEQIQKLKEVYNLKV